MCVILVAKNMDLTVEEITKAIDHNSDGNGVIIQDGKSLIVRKSIGEQDLLKLLASCKPSAKVMFHARIATSGGINDDMCHPFASESGRFLLMHNGVIGGKYHGDKTKSDTAKLADALDGIFSSKAKGREYMRNLAKDEHSRFVVFDKEAGSYELFGDWKFSDGVMRSNDNHLTFVNYGGWYGSKYGSYGSKVSRRTNTDSQKAIKEVQDYENTLAFGESDANANYFETWGEYDMQCIDCTENGKCTNELCQTTLYNTGIVHATAKLNELAIID